MFRRVEKPNDATVDGKGAARDDIERLREQVVLNPKNSFGQGLRRVVGEDFDRLLKKDRPHIKTLIDQMNSSAGYSNPGLYRLLLRVKPGKRR